MNELRHYNYPILFVVFIVIYFPISTTYSIGLTSPPLLCPEWCDCVATKESDQNNEIKLSCEWPYMPDTERLRFLIPAYQNNVVRLSLKCKNNNDRNKKFNLINAGLFGHLHKLKHLHISDCKLVNNTLPDGFSAGLGKLTSLHIERLHDSEDVKGFHFAPNSLSNLKSLQQLSIIDMNVQAFPNELCQMSELKLLNLSTNAIKKFQGTNCYGQQIIVLDLSNNKLANIEIDAFAAFKTLRVLKLGNNFLEKIQEHLFNKNDQLIQLSLNNNRLTTIINLPPKLQELDLSTNHLRTVPSPLSKHPFLQYVNLRNNQIESSSSITFEFNPKLTTIDLSFNKMEALRANFFGYGTTNISSLDFSNNQIQILEQHALNNLTKLHYFNLDNNNISHLSNFIFVGPKELYYLSLKNCNLANIERKTFFPLFELTTLDLANNRLTELPQSLTYAKSLQKLNISSNSLTTISRYPFWELENLKLLDLSKNKLSRIERFTFDRTKNLNSLILSHNVIQLLEPNSLDGATNLENLQAEYNLIRDVNGVFANLNQLKILNVSYNKIRHIDLALLPSNLKVLNASHNFVSQVTNFFLDIAGRSTNALKIVDFSWNKIDKLTKEMLPNSVEWALLNGNQIQNVDSDVLLEKNNLNRLELHDNLIETVIMPSEINRKRKLILTLSSNPLKCDCNLEWIKSPHNNNGLGQNGAMDFSYVVADFHRLTCVTEKNLNFRLIRNVAKSEFLCLYNSQCSADCLCCDFESCDCKNVCPENCTCFGDKTLSINEISCSNSWTDEKNTYESRLRFIPMHATVIRLDGLKLPRLKRNSFFGRYRLRQLYLNNSNIAQLSSKSFNGLTSLTVLDISWNFLETLNGNEFNSVPKVETLFLHNNRLRTLNYGAFNNLPNLKLLTLHGNYMAILPNALAIRSHSIGNPIPAVTLGQNPWKCDCDPDRFEFPRWLISHSNFVIDNKEIYCFENLTDTSPNATTILSLLPPTDDFDVVKVNFWTFVSELNKTFCYPDRFDANWNKGNGIFNSTNNSAVDIFDDSSTVFLFVSLSGVMSFFLISLVLWRFQHKKSTSSSATVSKYYEQQYGDTTTMANLSCGSGATTYLTTANPTPQPFMKYDAFVSYSMADERFVLDNIVSKLEKEYKYKLCLLYRDLDRTVSADRQHVDNDLIDAIEKSHRVLTIYSKDFVNDEWEQIRIRTAYQWLSHCKRRKSVIIMLDDTIPTDHALAKYMRLNLCYRYHDKLFWDNMLMVMPGDYYSTLMTNGTPYLGLSTNDPFRTLESGYGDASPYDTIDDEDVQMDSHENGPTIVPSFLI